MITTSQLLPPLKALLEGMTWNEEPLFQKVEYFTHTNLPRALNELRIFKHRVALIIPDMDDYRPRRSGRTLYMEPIRKIYLVFADRDYGRRQDAATGDADTPGVIAMKDQVEDLVAGHDLGLRGVVVMPRDGETMTIQSDEDRAQLTGREAWLMNLEIEIPEVAKPLKF